MLYTITVDFIAGRSLYQTSDPRKQKLFLALSIVNNFSILGFFKYFNFFMNSFDKLFNLFGFPANAPILNIVLPVGISFYTFQSMSYVVDVYRRQLKPANHWVDYAAYVSYFPQLVAGPIERGTHLLPQMLKPRTIRLDQFYEGCYLVFWGLFKKMFIADNLGIMVNQIFNVPAPYNGIKVLLGTYAFAFQIYCDFSGYSDIARGLGKCMGFDIMINFKLPYFATNPSDFWKRWHISLSTWLRDYLYIPLGGNQKGSLITYRNLIITMLLGGLWHGASWHFVIWGAYHGLLLCLYKLIKPYLEVFPKVQDQKLQNVWTIFKILFFFQLTCLGWLFFRANSVTQIMQMLYAVFGNFSLIPGIGIKMYCLELIFYTGLLLFIQLAQYRSNNLMIIFKTPAYLRGIFYFVCYYLIVIYGVKGGKDFIYFQF